MSAATLAAAVGLGAALGVATGLPIGVVNVAIVRAAAGGRRRFARGLGLGGAAADLVHAGVAFVGVGQAVTGRPAVVRALAVAAAAVIAGHALAAGRARQRRAPGPRDGGDGAPDGAPDGAADGDGPGALGRGALAGLALTLPNPAALAAWVAIAGALWPAAPLAVGLGVGAGVGLGSAAWFTALARWVAAVRRDHPALRLVPRVAGAALLALAAAGLLRAFTGGLAPAP